VHLSKTRFDCNKVTEETKYVKGSRYGQTAKFTVLI